MSAKSDPITTENQPIEPARPESSVVASLDFAHLVAGRLLVYGWILGFTTQVESAWIRMENSEMDLTAYAQKVSRPDVSQHFTVTGDEHGFYALIDLQHPVTEVGFFHLRIHTLSGETHDSHWTIQSHDRFSAIPPADLIALRTMLPALPALDRLRLARLLSDDPILEDAGLPSTLRLPMQLEIDSCCVLDGRIMVACGWLLDPANELIDVQVALGNERFDLLKASVSVARHDIDPESVQFGQGDSARLAGFILVQVIQPTIVAQHEAILAVKAQGADTAYIIRPVCWNAQEARGNILVLLSKMDLESGMILMERILSATQALPGMQSLRELLQSHHDRAVKRLSSSMQHTTRRGRYWLHIDHCIPVADKGVFLSGWCYSDNRKSLDLLYHCGELSFPVSANWIRHPRTDVTTYLQAEGAHVPDHEHGFTCYVPLKSAGRPPWLSTVSDTGDEWRMHVPSVAHESSTLQTVRRILATFHSGHRELRALMDRQVGPAVEAVWAAREKNAARAFVGSFGVRQANPPVSIIVPLYGRWDFAEYQMSQFADDPDFQNVDLIYVVDDPSIYDGFRHAAPNLFGIYQIPFTLAYSGANLGFSGANNFGAGHARGKCLLLVNSDVLPKRPGWVSELLRAYAALEHPGCLGARLLYEDGTLQHAGMEFRRYAPWGGLWINDHPFKGQMLVDLQGTREVSAVTAACLLIDAYLYRDLGGLSEDYIVGDFEDSDLCLRAIKAGRRNYIALDVELYHLERQSQGKTGDAVWRSNLTAYNCWLHNNRWSGLIDQVTGEQP